VQFDPQEYQVVEGQSAQLRIVLSQVSSSQVTVLLRTQDGTAEGN
jgi:hypothetical protein